MAKDISIRVEEIPQNVRDMLDSSLESAIQALTGEAKDLRKVYSRMESADGETFSLHAFYRGLICEEDNQIYVDFNLSFNDTTQEARCDARYSVNKIMKS